MPLADCSQVDMLGFVAQPPQLESGRGPGLIQLVGLEKEFCIDNLLVRIHFIIVMIRWTGLAPWDFEFPFPGSLVSTSLEKERKCSTDPGRQLKNSPTT